MSVRSKVRCGDGRCGESLGDRPDPKQHVLVDRLFGLDVRDAVAEERSARPVTNDPDSETGAGPAVENLGHLELQVELID